MELSNVGRSCYFCDVKDFLPASCNGCFRYFCQRHVSTNAHACIPARASLLDLNHFPDQHVKSVDAMVDLFLDKVIVNASRNGAEDKFRKLSLTSKALSFLPHVRGGLKLLESFGWKDVGNSLVLALPEDGTLDWRLALRMLAQYLERERETLMARSKETVGPRVQQTFTHFAVLDFEATCQEGPEKLRPQEIIELPVVLIEVATMRVVAEFHSYCRPVAHPTLSQFCTDLTGIVQSTVDGAETAQAVFDKLNNWLQAHGLIDTNGARVGRWTWVTCGDWDMRTALPNQWKQFTGKGSRKPPAYFGDWINLKIAFAKFYPGKKSGSMTAMLESLHMELIGRHHSGIDDARNIAAVLLRMLSEGYCATITTWRSK